MTELQSSEAQRLFGEIQALARPMLVAMNGARFEQVFGPFPMLKQMVSVNEEEKTSASDEYLNDLWVLARYIDFLESYGRTWQAILKHKFSDSWCLLQDSLDLLRLIKRFSRIDISLFERQLLELEKAYPYNVFFSIGALIKTWECSICGHDMSSLECSHLQGELYRGQMATAIAKEVVELNHISMVTRPKDKRCVVSYDDGAEQFAVVRHLAAGIAHKQIEILGFAEVRFSKRTILNPAYKKLPRNQVCGCGSGKKFKNCCITTRYTEGDHVDFIGEPDPFLLKG